MGLLPGALLLLRNPPMTDAGTEQLNAIDFYWRPGCGFCMMLDRALGNAGIPLEKYNIWDDPNHAATVRQHANGNETVPTIVIDDVALVNPSAGEVMSLLSVKAPHLLPEGWIPPKPSTVGDAGRRIFGR